MLLTAEEWAEIRRLHAGEQLGIKAIARRLGVSKNTSAGGVHPLRITPLGCNAHIRGCRA